MGACRTWARAASRWPEVRTNDDARRQRGPVKLAEGAERESLTGPGTPDATMDEAGRWPAWLTPGTSTHIDAQVTAGRWRSRSVDAGQTARNCHVDFWLLRRLLTDEESARLFSEGARSGPSHRRRPRRQPRRQGRRRRADSVGPLSRCAWVCVSAPCCAWVCVGAPCCAWLCAHARQLLRSAPEYSWVLPGVFFGSTRRISPSSMALNK